MGWISTSPEVWLACVLLVAIVAAIACAFSSRRPDARMIFFFHLLGDKPADEDPEPHVVETSIVKLKEGT